MAELVLRDSEQKALRELMTAEPVPGSPFPGQAVLRAVTRLIACDEICVALADNTGLLVDLTPGGLAGAGDPPGL